MHIQPIKTFTNFRANTNKVNSGATNPQAAQDVIKRVGQDDKITLETQAALAFRGAITASPNKTDKAPSKITAAQSNNAMTNETDTLIEKMQEQADELSDYAYEQADKAMRYSQKSFVKVMELFKKGDEIAPDGTVLRRITGIEARRIMEEFSADGSIVRRSIFKNGILREIKEGYKRNTDNSQEAARHMTFINGEPHCYLENHKEYADRSREAEKYIEFQCGELHRYREGFKKIPGWRWETAKELEFEDGKLSLYSIGHKVHDVHSWEAAVLAELKDGKHVWYYEDYKRLADGSEMAGRSFIRNNYQ